MANVSVLSDWTVLESEPSTKLHTYHPFKLQQSTDKQLLQP